MSLAIIEHNMIVARPKRLQEEEDYITANTESPKIVSSHREIPQSRIIWRQQDDIEGFLDANEYVKPLIFEAYRAISKHFGSDTNIALELMYDPEEPDATQLVAFIKTDLSPDRALKKLDQLYDDWWLSAAKRAKQQFSINLEFA